MSNINPFDNRPGDQQPKMPRFNMNWLYIAVLVFLVFFALSGGGNLLGVEGVTQEATYTKFKEYVAKGYASKVIINNNERQLRMYVAPKAIPAVFHLPADKVGQNPIVKVNYGSVDKVEDFLLAAQRSGKLKDYDYESKDNSGLMNLLYSFGPFILLIAILIFMCRRWRSGQRGQE